MAHIRQARPDSGLGFRVQVLTTFEGVPSSLGSGYRADVKRFWGGLVFKAHRLVYHSTLGLRVIKKKVTGARRLVVLGAPAERGVLKRPAPLHFVCPPIFGI